MNDSSRGKSNKATKRQFKSYHCSASYSIIGLSHLSKHHSANNYPADLSNPTSPVERCSADCCSFCLHTISTYHSIQQSNHTIWQFTQLIELTNHNLQKLDRLEVENATIRVENLDLQERVKSLVFDPTFVHLSHSQTPFRLTSSLDQNGLRNERLEDVQSQPTNGHDPEFARNRQMKSLFNVSTRCLYQSKRVWPIDSPFVDEIALVECTKSFSFLT